jgi:hypothetical protein
MSMVRTALRILAVEALKNATIAGPRVFDSRMDDLSPDLFRGDENAVILALTDKDEGSALSEQNGGPPFGRSCELSFEFGMTQRVEEGGETGLLYPNTDARLEAALDFMELQMFQHLAYKDDPLCNLFRRFWRITKYDCHRQIFEETAVKVACRVMTLTCYSGDDKIIIYNEGATPLPTGYDMLPDPLKSVAKLMPANSSGKDVCDRIVAMWSNLTLPQFGGMDNTLDNANTVPDDVPSTEVKTKIDVQTYP